MNKFDFPYYLTSYLGKYLREKKMSVLTRLNPMP